MAAGKKAGKKSPAAPPGNPLLRNSAEEQLARVPKRSADLHGQTPEHLIHELQVHQIELETQAEELRRVEFSLKESRDKFVDLYEFAPLGYLTLTDKALIAEVNLTGTTLLGVERSRLVNHGLGRFIAPGDHEVWDRYFARLRQHTEKQSCTLTLIRGNGSTFPARLEGIRIRGREGATSVRLAISDITDIWQIEALRASEEKYRRLFETAKDGILILDEDTNMILDVNTYLLDLLGFPRTYFIGKPLWELGFIRDTSLVRQAFTELKKDRYIRTEDLPLTTKDKRNIDVEFISNVYLVGDTKIIQCNIRDITARKHTEDALALTSRKLKLLSGITRHDINNQLLTLHGFVGLLHEEAPAPSLEGYFTRITTAIDQIASMIRFTREYEKIGVDAPVWQDCRTLIDTATQQAPPGNLLVKNELPGGMEVFADPLIVKVCYTLMDNAVRHGGKITAIRFFAEEHDGVHIVVCEDDGEGVAAGEKERIFERGFGKNTGFGLTLAREILEITGITIRETGEAGKGARFEMTIPEGAYRSGVVR